MRPVDRVRILLKQGWGTLEIARDVGCSASLVSHTRRRDRMAPTLAAQRLAERQARKAEKQRLLAARVKQINAATRTGKWNGLAPNDAVIAAVDSGLTYLEVARLFGLRSRNCVAGIVHRRPKGRA